MSGCHIVASVASAFAATVTARFSAVTGTPSARTRTWPQPTCACSMGRVFQVAVALSFATSCCGMIARHTLVAAPINTFS